MTNQEIISRINKIQEIAYLRKLTREERKEWRGLQAKLRLNGMTIKGYRDPSTKRKIWCLISIEVKRTERTNRRNNRFICEWENRDTCPNKKHLVGNCTTRALCLIYPNMSYDEIEARQYKYGKELNTVRNASRVMVRMTMECGYSMVHITPTRRDKVAYALRNFEYPILSHSSQHIAGIVNGKVVDTWDSRGGKVTILYVHNSELEKTLDIFNR